MYQIIMILIALSFSGVYYFLINKKNSTANKDETLAKKTAQDFVNIKDIRDKYAYTKDGLVYMYIKIHPIDVDLMSSREQVNLEKELTAELSSDSDTIKLICVSRPIDIAPLINEYNELLINSTDNVQKTLLKHEMLNMNDYAMSGEVVERQFYLHLWHKYEDGAESNLNKRAYDLISKFSSCQTKCEILFEQEIYRLYNLFNNPATINVEDASFEASIPLMIG